MNIWVFNHYAHPPDLPGGTRYFDLARELIKRGHRVTIFASSFHHGLHRETRLGHREKWRVEDVEGVQWVWLRTPPYQRNDWRRIANMVTYMVRAWRLGRRLPTLAPEIGKPDVIIGSSVHLLAVLAAYWVARRDRVKFVMEVRDLWPQTIVDMGEMSKRHPAVILLGLLERFLYRKAERIITPLPRAHEYIAACGVPPSKIVWIPNGVDLSRFPYPGTAQGSSGTFRIVYVGAHGQANALDVLIEAARVLQDTRADHIQFILFGSGPEKPRLMQLADQLGLRNVEFLDPIPKQEIPRVVAEADAAVAVLRDLPLYKYGISLNKLYDYMAAGRPVVLAGSPGNNPVTEAGCGLAVPPNDPKALADAMLRLAEMASEELAEMGRRGREYVEKHHAIPVLAERLEGVLDDVVRGA